MKMVALSLSLSLSLITRFFILNFCVHIWKALEGSEWGVFFDRRLF